jgi:putative redox protein
MRNDDGVSDARAQGRYDRFMERTVTVSTAGGKFRQTVRIGGHAFIADEPKEAGGDDAGPNPHELLLSALGTCTSMTLGVYAERKGWKLRGVNVTVSGDHQRDAYVIKRDIVVDGDLDDEQRARLLEIANKCPVHKTLSGTIRIDSALTAKEPTGAA